MQVVSNESAVYYPEELSLLGKVVDQIVQSLPTDLGGPGTRMMIARDLLACFRTGERDPEVLKRAALMNATVPVAA
jgi:hypothetical protein